MSENNATTENTDYRKTLRQRVALLTGLIVMREDLDGDIAEIMGQMRNAPSNVNGNGNGSHSVREATERKLLPPAAATEDPAAAPASQARFWSPAAKKRASDRLKAKWARAKAGGPHPFAPANSKKAKPVKPAKTAKAAKATVKSSATKYRPIIGEGTNADFIYRHAVSHGGRLNYAEAKAAAAQSREHKNLTVGSRLSVAIAEMKRKRFLDHTGGIGNYRLTDFAVQIRQREDRERQ